MAAPGKLEPVPRKPPFDAVVTQHGPAVLRVARAVVGPVDADDAWSETFLAALRAYPDLPADANVEAWLVTIAHRKAIDVVRAASRRAVPMAEPPERQHATNLDMSTDRDAGIDPDAGIDLVAAVAALPDKQRRAVAYHYFGGLPYADVADVLGGTATAARRAAADGIAALRLTMGARP